uniref:Protein kinase domain-containing protein n=1 Tax=Araucaria cunninghamii TaxID=56994 RepID=A0A0D6R537_ARACU
MGFPTRVGKYELGRMLGEGTFAKVKVARNVETGQQVAVKIIDKEMVLKHNLMYQVKREISTMKLVKHPNIVRLYEVLASRRKIYLVMEYVTGGELNDRLTYLRKMSEQESRKYFHQLIDAIEYCHSRNVYHRDLKPENLLLDGKGNLKVSDFGLSVLHQTDTILTTSCGSPNYVAPEVIIHNNYDGAAADVWSCGVILFEMLAGFSPFEDPNLINQYRKICEAEYSFPSWFSHGSRKLISKILEPGPKKEDLSRRDL